MQKLIDVLTQQLSIYEELFEKTTIEKEAFTNKNNDLFMSVLADRLNLMKEIGKIEEELKPMREEWVKSKENYSITFNQRVIELIKSIKNLMGKILDIESTVIAEKMKEQQEVIGVPKGKAISKYKKM